MNKDNLVCYYEELRASGFEPKVAAILAAGTLLADKLDNLDARLLDTVDALEEGAGLVERRV